MGRRLTRPRTAVLLIVVLVTVLIGVVVVVRPSADERALRNTIRALAEGDTATLERYLSTFVGVSARQLARSAETDPVRFVSATRTGDTGDERHYDLRFKLGDEEYTRPVTVSDDESERRFVKGLLMDVRLVDRATGAEVSVESAVPPGRFQFWATNLGETVDYEGDGVVAGDGSVVEVPVTATVNARGHNKAYVSLDFFLTRCAIDGSSRTDAPCPKIDEDASWSVRSWEVTDTSPAHYGGETTIAVFDDAASDESRDVTVPLYVDLTHLGEEVVR